MMLSVVARQTLFAISPPRRCRWRRAAGRALAVAGTAACRSYRRADHGQIRLADVDIRPQWSGAFLIAGTPPAIARKLEAELRRLLTDGSVRDKLKAIAYDAGGGPGEEFARQIDTDIRVFSDVIKAANLKFE